MTGSRSDPYGADIWPRVEEDRSTTRGSAIVKPSRKPGRASSVALLGAAIWGLGLVVAGLLVPAYQSTEMSSSGELAQTTKTLVGMNGPGVLVVLAVPFLVTLLVASALLARSRRAALPFAWALTALLAAFNLVGMLTVGVFVLPVTAALVVACSMSSKTGAAIAP